MAYNIEINGLEFKNAAGINVIGSDFKVEIKELDELNRTFWAIASEESPDRDKDIIRVEGWNLKNYKNKPRGLWMHDYFGFPIFRSEKIKVDKAKKQLLFKPKFDDSHENARVAFNQYKNGFLDDFSVGFIPGVFEFFNENDRWGGGRDFVKGHELLEISGVTVPAHPNAGMLRSMGLIPEDQISLMTLGFKPEFLFDEQLKSYWYPILLDMNAYRIPKNVKLGNGITVVKAFPRFDEEKELIVGYYFDQSKFRDEKSVSEWIDSQLLVKPTMKYYQIDFNEDKELDISIKEKQVDVPILFYDFGDEEDENKDLSTSDVPEPMLEQDGLICSCETFEASEGDDSKCKGCGGRKPKAADPAVVPDEDDDNDEDDKGLELSDDCTCSIFEASEDNSEKCKGCGGRKPKAADPAKDNKSLNNEEKNLKEELQEILKNIVQNFDKSHEDSIKDIVTELDIVKAELVEVKGLLLKMAETNKSLENNSDDQLIDLSELSAEDLVQSPVSKDLEDDSNKIEIDSESFKQMSKDAVIEALSETFKSIFEQEKDNLSGKLED